MANPFVSVWLTNRLSQKAYERPERGRLIGNMALPWFWLSPEARHCGEETQTTVLEARSKVAIIGQIPQLLSFNVSYE